EQVIQRFRAGARDDQPIGDLGLVEREPGQLDVVGVVFDQQDFRVHHVACSCDGVGAAAAGKATRNVLPSPGADPASMLPPWRSATRRAMASPMPLPAPSSGECSRWNGSNSLAA